jgi:hypothetical protein
MFSLDKSNPQTLWSRSCLGKFAYRIEQIPLDEEQPSPVDQWLRSLANNDQKQQQQPNSNNTFQSAGSARKKSSPAVEELFDPFQVRILIHTCEIDLFKCHTFIDFYKISFLHFPLTVRNCHSHGRGLTPTTPPPPPRPHRHKSC